MNSKQFVLDEQVTITIAKRSSNRQMRLTINGDGTVRVSMPKWVPYAQGVRFAKSRLNWIKAKIPERTTISQGQKVGKSHRLMFKPTDKQTITTRLTELEAVVFCPKGKSIIDDDVQSAAKKVIKKALQSQGSQLLPMRLQQLAEKYNYSYSSVKVKSLKTRWGSCDNHKNITLNLYLMELPWELIDYVLLHELNHTLVMQHGPKFWQELKLKLPNYLELKRQLRTYSTLV